MAKVTIVIEDVGGRVDVRCMPENPNTMVQGISRENTLAQNMAAAAMMTIEVNASRLGAQTIDLSTPSHKHAQ